MTISLTQPAIGSTGWGDDVNTNFDAIETAINTGGAGGPPTPTTWGANTETLAADKALVDGDDTIQYLNPAGADRAVYLPAPGASNKLFLIYNAGTAADLVVRRGGSPPLATLAAGDGAWCASDDSAWAVFSLGRAGAFLEDGIQVYSWAGDSTTLSRRLEIHQRSDQGTFNSTDIPATAYEIPSAGTVDKIVQVVQTNGNQTHSLYKNGASSESLTSSSFTATGAYFSKTHDTNTSVSASDYLSIVLTASATPVGDQRVFAFMRGAAGLELRWGGTNSGSARLFYPHYLAGVISSTADTVTEHMIGVACSDVALAHATQTANSTTVFKVWKNGAVVDTLALAGAFGVVATAGTAYAVGDGVTIENDAGTVPNASNITLSLTTTGVLATTFAGDSNAPGAFMGLDHGYDSAPTGATATQEHGFIMPFAARSLVDAFQTVSLSSETWALRKNGATDQTINPDTAEEIIDLSGTLYAAGDYMEMTCSVSGANDARHRVHFAIFGGQ